jgi:hypothetical protein
VETAAGYARAWRVATAGDFTDYSLVFARCEIRSLKDTGALMSS